MAKEKPLEFFREVFLLSFFLDILSIFWNNSAFVQSNEDIISTTEVSMRLMRYFISSIVWLSVFSCLLSLATSCEDSPAKQPNGSLVETESIAFVPTKTKKQEDINDISILNDWLKTNPTRKIVSFSCVITDEKAVSGYLIYFIPGDGSKQRFVKIPRYDLGAGTPDPLVHGIMYLQMWQYTHPENHLIDFSATPNVSGGVTDFIVLYEPEYLLSPTPQTDGGADAR